MSSGTAGENRGMGWRGHGTTTCPKEGTFGFRGRDPEGTYHSEEWGRSCVREKLRILERKRLGQNTKAFF